MKASITIGRIADIVTLALAAVAISVGARHAFERQTGPDQQPPSRTDRRLDNWPELLRNGHWVGPHDAAVVILEFGDYECPFCRRAERNLQALRRLYPQQVAVVYRHWPLSIHPNAYRAVKLAVCASDQDRFEEMHRVLYSAITLEGMDPSVVAAAADIPDSASFIRCATDTSRVPRIEEDIELAGELSLFGVPAIAVNGLLLGTPPDSVGLLRLVEAELLRVGVEVK